MSRQIGPQYFFEVNRKEERTRCTTHSWTSAWGQVARMASGKPFKPSQQTMKVSWMPRLRNSVSTLIQNLAPSPPARADPQAQHVAFAVHVDAHGDIDGPVGDLAVADLDHDRVDQHHRIDAVQRPV